MNISSLCCTRANTVSMLVRAGKSLGSLLFTFFLQAIGFGVAILVAMQEESSFPYKGECLLIYDPSFAAIELLNLDRGFSFGYSAFINSHFLGSGQGSSQGQDGVDILSPTFSFTPEQLAEGDNGEAIACYDTYSCLLSNDVQQVLTIIHDSTGMNQDCECSRDFPCNLQSILTTCRQYQ